MNEEQKFINEIFKVAEKQKGQPLNDNEKIQLIKVFNNIPELEPFERAKRAIKKVIGGELPEEIFFEFLGGTINSLNDLLIQLQSAASEWEKKNKK